MLQFFTSADHQRRADIGMSIIIFIWGFHFIVLKDGLNDLAPLTYNAIRFTLGMPLMIGVALLNRDLLRITWRDFGVLLVLGIIGSVLYQALLLNGLNYTTSTNSALLNATMPTWVAVISLIFGMIIIHRRLVTGIVITLAGVVLVVLGKSGAELAISADDLLGSGLVLGAAVVLATNNILKKPVVDRLGSLRVAVWMYWFTALGMVVLALPDLVTLRPASFPTGVLPNLLYSGMLAGVGGFLTFNFAIGALGPTRASTYFNFTPVIAAFAGIMVLGEPLTVPLLSGGALTLLGVLTVRQNIFTRRPPPPAPGDQPAPERAAR